MNHKICLHAINAGYNRYNAHETNKVLNAILESNAILSLRMQHKKSTSGFNGLDYISLCDYEKRNLFHENDNKYNAYQGYIKYSLSIIFPKDKLKIITPTITDISNRNIDGCKEMEKLGNDLNVRYSDLYDEVQVKDKIPLELMSGITLPLHIMHKSFYSEQKTIDMVISELKKIRDILYIYGYNVPIYDINTLKNLENVENIKKLVKLYYRKYRD